MTILTIFSLICLSGLILWGSWQTWDTFRPRGTIRNPLSGGRSVKVPTTHELRKAKREHPATPVPPWRSVQLEVASKLWSNPCEEGQRVYVSTVGPLLLTTPMLVVTIVARAGRFFPETGPYMEYLGEVADPAGSYRLTFTHDKIWGVVDGEP